MIVGFLIWILVVGLLIEVQSYITYLGLELAWAFLVIILQLTFGADVLWRNRRLIVIGVIPLTLYLSLTDAIAIQSGVWTINPDKSLGVLIGGVLPIEELTFFLLTNIMVMFGFILVWSQESQTRLKGMWKRIKIFIRNPMLSVKLR